MEWSRHLTTATLAAAVSATTARIAPSWAYKGPIGPLLASGAPFSRTAAYACLTVAGALLGAGRWKPAPAVAAAGLGLHALATETHYPHPETQPVTGASKALTVYVHNVLTTNSTGVAGLSRQAQKLDADVVALIETTSTTCQSELDALATAYPYSHIQASHAPVGTAVFSRFPLSDVTLIQEGNIRLGFTGILLVHGQPVRIFVVHPMAPVKPSWTRLWLRDLQTLAARINDSVEEQVLVMGDFNADPAHGPYRELLESTGAQDVSPGLTTWPAKKGVPAFYAIDHVLVKGGLEHTAARRTPALGSDHYGIVARLRLTSV